MASLEGIDPKQHGDDNLLPCGWTRVITGPCSLKYVGQNKTPQIEQAVFDAENGLEMKAQHWVSPKGLPSFVSWAEAAGLDRDARREIDTETVETLQVLEDRNLWVFVDYRRNDKNGKWYKEICRWRMDSEERPAGEPKHLENPAFSHGGGHKGGNGSAAYTPDPDEDIPF